MTEPAVTQSLDIETRKEAVAVGGEAAYWLMQLDLAHQDHRDWLKDGQEVVRRYKGQQKNVLRSNNKRFNILFSNTETLMAALFARMGKPDIRRRFADRDAIGKQVADIVERAALYCDDSYDSYKEFEAALQDYLLPGRGIVRVCYDTDTTDKDGKEYVSKQELYDDYVPWDEFRHEPAKKWKRVGWVAFRHLMSREDLRENKFNDPDAIPLNWSPKADDEKIPDAFKRAVVWEIWDKTKRQRLWVVEGHKVVLRTDEDPYGLEDFFPIAEPLQAITTNDTFIPEPEFHIYRDQADGLDEIEARIDRLTRALKRRGVYDATFAELKRLSKAADNEFVPVKNYAELSTKGGLAAAFQAEDISTIAKVLAELHSQRDLRVQTIYEVVGIADIMRGSSDPRETLGAQKIKAQFGGNRLKKRQDKVQKWVRDTLRLKAEIIAEHFEPQKLAEMTGFKILPPEQMQAMQMQAQQTGKPPSVDGLITPEMIEILRSDRLRSYRIDIETDSTVFEDAEQEKQARVEMLTAMSTFLEKSIPAGQALPELTPLMFEMLAFGLRAFKAGKSLEEPVDQARDQILQRLKNPQPKPPDPKVEAERIKAEAVKQKADLDAQAQQQKLQTDQAKAQMDLQMQQQKHQLELEKMRAELMMQREEMALMQQKLGMEAEAMEAKAALEERTMALQAESAEHQHALGMEATEHKHKVGMEMMEHKAKQAKAAKPKGGARA